MGVAQKRKQVVETAGKRNVRSVKLLTPARIGLGRTGTSVPLKESLAFKFAHAYARDAVYSVINYSSLFFNLQKLKLPYVGVKSKIADRKEYLQRPDLGRQLNPDSRKHLKQLGITSSDIAIIVGDGLSSIAVNNHVFKLLQLLVTKFRTTGYTVAPVVVVENARVAIADEIGVLLKAKLTIILIGERPGLSSPDSLGAYLTHSPKRKLTNEARNCVSNIRPEGLDYKTASNQIFYLVQQAFKRKSSGIKLKDEMELLNL